MVLLCIVAFIPSQAQTVTQNLSTLNADELSEAQVRQLIQQAQSSGYSDAQIVQMAQAKGMPAAQAPLLEMRIAELRKKDALGNNGDISFQPRRVNGDTTKVAAQPSADFFAGIQTRIYGASLFRNATANTFEPNLKVATPVNYIVGPDDQIVINVYGNSVANWKLDVSADGNINIPGIGIMHVSGSTIEQATAAIKRKLIANRYAIGNGTSVDVTLGNIRSIKVSIQGEAVKPGTYTISSFSTVFNALYSAGGPNDIGSFRTIEVIRNNRIVRRLDLYDILTKGNQKDNIALQDQDVIRIPTYRIRVDMRGEIKIPALFEVLPGETLQDVINFGGGFTDQAYTARIKITQVSDKQLKLTDVYEADFKNYTPLRGDKYVVERILNRFENRVIINGAVFHPGEFELQKGLTVSQLIKNAGGLKEDAFTGRGSIIRLNADNSTQQISFNVQDALTKPGADVLLQREDNINISSIFDLRSGYAVTIKGEVRNPGDFAYADSMKVQDLIIRAGGFTEGASTKRIEVSRRMYDSDPSIKNSSVAQVFNIDINNLNENGGGFTLKPFDIVSIYSLPGYETQKLVKVEGEVIYPGYYAIQKKNEKISDLLERAGGLTQSADVDGASLKRNNDAILGIDKSKIDTVALNKERADRLKQFQRTYTAKERDSVLTNTASEQYRNNFVGINLKKIIKNPGVHDDLILDNGDVLRVPKQQQLIKVNGEVLYPSAVIYSSGKSFKGYVMNAGGFSAHALKRGAYVVYPNGTVKGTSKFLFFNIHPKVRPGSEIYIPKKAPSNANTGQLILGYTTGLASLGAIILGILSLNK